MERFTSRALQVCLFLLALSAPISIAATQTAWAFALLFWIVRSFLVRPTFKKDAFDLALIVFLGLTVLSSVFSYEPEISLRKLVPVSLVTIVYLVAGQAKNVGFRRRIVAVLLVGAAASVVWTIAVLAIGKNLKVTAMTADSPLRAAGVLENDTIWRVDGVGIHSTDDLKAVAARHAVGDRVGMTYYRQELVFTSDLRIGEASSDPNDLGMGVTEWTRGRDTRASGFFGHYMTYAEAIQLILSLAFGLFIAAPGSLFSRNKFLLGAAVAAYSVALFLTITRASWAGFLLSAAVIVFIGTSRRTVLICIALAIPLAIAGLFYLQQKRNVGLIDTADGSTAWRLIVWREAVDVLVSDPRHLLVGVGMDSIKTRWPEWHMFDNGRQPLGHLHSNPLQFAFERGVPALIAWLVWMFIYLRMLWRRIRSNDLEWPERGLLLGALGGTLGFLASGVVHYNWGDSEVVMVFYLIMGLGLAVVRPDRELTESVAP